PVGAWLFSGRRWHALRMEEFAREERQYRDRELRYLKLTKDILSLRGVQVVASSLAWGDRYPLGGGSPLTRWFDDAPQCSFLWLRSAGNTGGQPWAGPFRDDNENGVLEFAAPGVLPPRRWTRELNFLGWRPYGGESVGDLPAGAKVRVSLQWREPHDPEF